MGALGKIVSLSGKTIGFLKKHEKAIKKGVKIGGQVANAVAKGGNVVDNLADVAGENTNPIVGQVIKGANTLAKNRKAAKAANGGVSKKSK